MSERKTHCKHGHEYAVVGRYGKYRCAECRRMEKRAAYIDAILRLPPEPPKPIIEKVDRRLVRFCPWGHDTHLVGRVKSGQCKECAYNRVTVWRWGKCVT